MSAELRYFRVAKHTQIALGEDVFGGGETFGIRKELAADAEVWIRNGWAEEVRKPAGKVKVASPSQASDVSVRR